MLGLSYADADVVTLSALDIVSIDAPDGTAAVAVIVDGADEFAIVDSRIVAGAAGAAAARPTGPIERGGLGRRCSARLDGASAPP